MQLAIASVLLMASAAVGAPVSPPRGHVPESACVDMVPIHGDAKPSDRPSPYTITASPTTVRGGDTVTVRISGTEAFRGVYLQARTRQQEPVGEFLVPSKQISGITVSSCPPGHNNAIEYISRKEITGLDIEWVAPNIDAEIVFRATFVKTFSEFWVGVETPYPIVVEAVIKINSAVAA